MVECIEPFFYGLGPRELTSFTWTFDDCVNYCLEEDPCVPQQTQDTLVITRILSQLNCPFGEAQEGGGGGCVCGRGGEERGRVWCWCRCWLGVSGEGGSGRRGGEGGERGGEGVMD